MTRRCWILESADREIDAQIVYYAESAGVVVAERFYAAVKEAFASLMGNPGQGRPFESPHVDLEGLQIWLVRGFPFLIYYRKVDDGIEIVHVLHGSRDHDRIVGRQ